MDYLKSTEFIELLYNLENPNIKLHKTGRKSNGCGFRTAKIRQNIKLSDYFTFFFALSLKTIKFVCGKAYAEFVIDIFAKFYPVSDITNTKTDKKDNCKNNTRTVKSGCCPINGTYIVAHQTTVNVNTLTNK